MIEAVAKIGKIQREKRGITTHLDELIQNVYDPASKKVQYLLKIVLKKDSTSDGSYKFQFAGIEREELKADSCKKMLYRSFRGVGINPSPSAAITDKDTFGLKILKLLERSAKETADPQESRYFQEIYNTLLDNQDEIRNQIDLYKNSNKEMYFLTLTFVDANSEEKYLSDDPPFVNLFLRSVGDKESRYGSIGTCSICGKENVEVFGGVSPYKFFNLDKDGFLAGFSKDESYKNFPICAECIRDLNEGKDYISKNLTFTFVRGLQYQLIPQPLQDDANLEYILNIIEAQKQDTSNLINGENLQHITESENDITFLLKDAADTVSLNFLFLKVSNSAEKILALIQDVLPSRLNTLYTAKNNVESTFANLTNYDFTFGTIRQFFPREDPSFKGGTANKVGLDKYFLDVTDRIFKGRTIDNDFLFQFITNRVRAEFVKLLSNQKNNYRFITIDGLRVISFLNYLKLIRIKEVKMEQRQFDGFFKNFGNLFQDPLKRGLFLLGAATQMFLDVQNNVRGSAPFLKQLKSLRMNERDFKELLVKVQDKVNEYENVTSDPKNQYKLADARTFLREASYYLLQSQKFDMSVPEMNFYFACGMNLSQDLVSHLVSSLVSQKSEEGENESD